MEDYLKNEIDFNNGYFPIYKHLEDNDSNNTDLEKHKNRYLYNYQNYCHEVEKISFANYLNEVYEYFSYVSDEIANLQEFSKNQKLKTLIYGLEDFYEIIAGFYGDELTKLEFYHQEIGKDLKNVEKEKPKRRHTDINFKFALLEEMGLISWLKNNIPTNNKDRAEILMELIGGAETTLIDYLKDKSINKDVRQKALDFINEKRYPK